MKIMMKELFNKVEYSVIEHETMETVAHSTCSRLTLGMAKSLRRTFGGAWLAIALLILITAVIGVARSRTISSQAAVIARQQCVIDSMTAVENESHIHTMIGAQYIDKKGTVELTPESLYEFVAECNMWYPDIFMAKCQQESAMGKSRLARDANNLCGMRKVKGSRLANTTQVKDTDCYGYGVYDNWQLCVLDHVLWDYDRFGYKKPTREEYLAAQSIYAEGPRYAEFVSELSKNFDFGKEVAE